MTKIVDLKDIPADTDILGGVDITTTFAELFKEPKQMPGCLFLLCTKGSCKINVHLDNYQMKKDSLAVIFPGVFFQIMEQSADCRFVFLGFSEKLIHSSRLFSYSIEFTPYIFECPVLNMKPKAGRLIKDYFLLYVRSKQFGARLFNREQAMMAYTQLILGIGGIFRNIPESTINRNRDQEIIKLLLRKLINKYKQERSITFYADQLHLSAQYLSSTIKKMTGKTLTELIANLVVHDAKAKLLSTELTIQEIADSLNFADISSFGKYFKRHTGTTPSDFRKSRNG